MWTFQRNVAGTLFSCSHCTSCASCVKTVAVSDKTSCILSKLQLCPSAYKATFTVHCHVAVQQYNVCYKATTQSLVIFLLHVSTWLRLHQGEHVKYNTEITLPYIKNRGRDSAAGVVTGYGLDSSGVRTPVEARDFSLLYTRPGRSRGPPS